MNKLASFDRFDSLKLFRSSSRVSFGVNNNQFKGVSRWLWQLTDVRMHCAKRITVEQADQTAGIIIRQDADFAFEPISVVFDAESRS